MRKSNWTLIKNLIAPFGEQRREAMRDLKQEVFESFRIEPFCTNDHTGEHTIRLVSSTGGIWIGGSAHRFLEEFFGRWDSPSAEISVHEE
jgi:hypothetical protein